jgi:hypothetical protein
MSGTILQPRTKTAGSLQAESPLSPHRAFVVQFRAETEIARGRYAGRGVGSGFTYHAGAALGALTPFVIGALQDAGWELPQAMAVCIGSSLVIVIAMLWIGPETRGRSFLAVDGS